MLDVAFINAYIIWCLGNGSDRREHSHHGGRYDFMMRLVKELAGIKEGAGASSPSNATRSPISHAGSSKRAKTMSKMGDDVKLECNGPIPVEYKSFPKYCHLK